jgi:hypothetical protein
MSGPATTHHRCRGCGSGAVGRVLDLGPQPAADYFPPVDTPGEEPRRPLELRFFAQGRTVIGYGAPSKAPVLLYMSPVGPDLELRAARPDVVLVPVPMPELHLVIGQAGAVQRR